jgi:bacteriorhodopsin
MMMNSVTILWITTLLMTAGGLLILLVGKRRTPSEQMQTILHGLVPIIAACAYFAMATGQGSVTLPTDAAIATGTHATRIFYWARYVDWTVTTPLLLVSLGLSGVHSGRTRSDLLLGAVLADLLMIVTAFAFGASEVAWMKWTWFIISCVAFLGVYYVIWGPQMQANARERDDIRASYRRHSAVLSVLWLVYPIVLAVAPDGANVISDSLSVLAIAIVDLAAKVVYGLMTIAADKSATDRDLTEGGTTATSAML